MINLVINQKLTIDLASISLRGFDNNQTISNMTSADLHKLLYTPCNKCSKCPYDCNKFEFIIDTRNETDTVPVPKEDNKECYEQLEFINI